MSRTNRVGLRHSIIQVSLEIGSELGEEGLTMRGIAARLGVSATALYQHFESKTSILREIRIYGVDLLVKECIDPCMSMPDPVARMKCMAGRYVAFARTHPWLYTVLMQSEQLDWTAMSADEIELTLRPLTTLRSWLREGAERGCWRKGLDPDVTSIRLWASLHGLCSMILSGRIAEHYPAFPIANQSEFIQNFIDGALEAIIA